MIALIARFCGDLEVPVLVFNNEEEAYEYCSLHLPEEYKHYTTLSNGHLWEETKSSDKNVLWNWMMWRQFYHIPGRF